MIPFFARLRTPGLRVAAALLLVLGVGIANAGCGNDESSDSSEGSGGEANVAYAEEQLANYRDAPEFSPPGPPIDVAQLSGQQVTVIPLQSYDYCNEIDARMQKVGEEYGVSFDEFPNQGKPQEWVQGMQTAINQKADAILLTCGLTPELLLPQIEAAEEAGIPVLSSHVFDAKEQADSPCGAPAAVCEAGLAASINSDFATIGKIQADWAIADAGGENLHALILPNPEAGNTTIMGTAIEDEINTHCDNCTVKVVEMSLADWPAKVQSETRSAAIQDPELVYVFPIYDSFVQPVIAGAGAAGAGTRIKAIAFNGTPDALELLASGESMVANVGESVEWLAYAYADQTFRVLADEKPVEEGVPIRLYDAENVADAGTPPEWGLQGFGDSFIEGYRDLWSAGA